MNSYRPHKINLERRENGTIIATSGYPLGDVVNTTIDWIKAWADKTPNEIFIAERSGDGWRSETYLSTLQKVERIAAALNARGMGQETPIVIMSANSVDHALISYGAQYAGVPTVPVAEQYSLIPAAHSRLIYVLEMINPAMVFAEDGAQYGSALALDEMKGREILVSKNAGEGMTSLDDLLAENHAVDLDAVLAGIGPDTIAKILMTSGSTSNPKGVLTTQEMMCVNQTQIADALTFLRERPPVLLDWLPWNHVFGGSHNLNMALANGGQFYIDGGKPVPALIGKTFENINLVSPTLAFNVPVGYAQILERLQNDDALAQKYFENLDMLFYAGASLPQNVWAGLEDIARKVRGEIPLFTSSWGLTETAPACLIQHELTDRSGVIGVPMTGLEMKFIPDETDPDRYEARVRGPNIMKGYYKNPEKTAEAFDDEGFFITGDAMRFVDPAKPELGLKFDSRLSEEFKLVTGTWVRAGQMRLDVLAALKGFAQDVVICGEGRDEVGLLVFPVAGLADGKATDDGVVTDADLLAQLADKLAEFGAGRSGSANKIARAVILSDAPSMELGEATAKGNLNFRKILDLRKDKLDRLYSEDAAVVLAK
jgi:feruloyl-CoA synthase